MPHDEPPDIAELAYEAALGGIDWQAVGEALKTLLRANTASLWAGQPSGGGIDMLYAANIPQEATRDYVAYYHSRDPWTHGFLSSGASAPGTLPSSVLGAQILPDSTFRRSEFYQDFARGIGLFHLLGAVTPLGRAGGMFIGFHRPENAPPFGTAEREALDALLPHLRRALRLRYRLQQAAPSPAERAAAAALHALPLAALVSDAEGQVLTANPAAEALLQSGRGLALRREAPPPARPRLTAGWKAEDIALARLIQSVALGCVQGASLALSPPPGSGAGPLVLLATPLPARLDAGAPAAPRRARHVLLLLRDLGRPAPPDPALLAHLFGLTEAEALVACALLGGRTAEAVAEARGVGLPTIRAQIRSILEKTGAHGLRDLERILATLGGA